jgi:ABC-type Fe3+/spermidine/putrescine transport system ATPase subunit
MTVSQNIAYPLKQRGFSKSDIADKVNKAMQLVQLNEFADRYPKQRSGGQQQRVALARAVVYDPRALLLDEPLGALDKKLSDQLQVEVNRMRRELGMTLALRAVTSKLRWICPMASTACVCFNLGTQCSSSAEMKSPQCGNVKIKL